MTAEDLLAAKVMLRSTRAPILVGDRTIVAFSDADPFGIAARKPADVPTVYFVDGTMRAESELLTGNTAPR